jgi:hypothetical protein
MKTPLSFPEPPMPPLPVSVSRRDSAVTAGAWQKRARSLGRLALLLMFTVVAFVLGVREPELTDWP